MKSICLALFAALTGSANWLEAPRPVPGKHVRVELKSGATQRGILEAVAPDSLTLEGKAPIGRSAIRLVQVRTGMSRGKRASGGAKIGAITGGIIYGTGAAVAAATIKPGGAVIGASIVTGVGFSTGVGALIGAMPISYQTIYTAP